MNSNTEMKRIGGGGGGNDGGGIGRRNAGAMEVSGIEAEQPQQLQGRRPIGRGSSASSNQSGGSGSVVKFAMPEGVPCASPDYHSSNRALKVNRIGPPGQGGGNASGNSSGSLSSEGNACATGSSLSLSSAGSVGKKRKAPGNEGMLKSPPELLASQQTQNGFSQSSETSNSGQEEKAPATTAAGKNDSGNSNAGAASSGSGSDNNGSGGATSSSGRSSGNAAVVTASTANNNTTTSGSGSDDRSSSGSGAGRCDSGSGSGANRRSGGEASAEYYYAGYGSGPSLGASSGNQAQAALPQAPQAMGESVGMPSFASFQGAPLAAAAQAAAAGPAQQVPQGPGVGPRHVAVATDEGGLPPPPHAFASHLRHHSRHHGHQRQGPAQRAPPQAQAPAAQALPPQGPPARQRQHGLPAAPTASHYELRLPPSDEQAVLQRVPRTHATVVAHDLPPPPTSSDAWSSASGSGGSNSRRRRRPTANAAPHAAPGQPMVASVRLANGGTFDSVNLSGGSPSSSSDSSQAAMGNEASGSGAMHVTMDDPILRKKISLKHEQPATKPLEAKPSADAADKMTAVAQPLKPPSKTAVKRKLSAMSRANTSSSDVDSSASENGAAETDMALGSGSDEGYAASSERQSGSGSGSDSISSDDANKGKKGAAAAAQVKAGSNANVRNASQNSKRTETSSMSSSVLADFSSVVNEGEGSIALDSLSRSVSPRSESSLSDEGAAAAKAQGAAAGTKRDASHLGPAANTRKRTKPTEPASKPPSQPGSTGGEGNNTMKAGISIMERSLQQKVRSAGHHHHHYHSRSAGRKMLEKSFLSAKRDLVAEEGGPTQLVTSGGSAMARTLTASSAVASAEGKSAGVEPIYEDATIYSLGQDVMAQVVSFLEPPEAHSFLTQPLSKTWLVTYTAPQELWKILCTSKPFYAKLDESVCGSSDASACSFPICNDLEMRHLFGRYRLLYTSFVRCMKYLGRLQDDALNGRTPSVYANTSANDIYPYNKNTSLKAYFAKARRLVRSNRRGGSRSSSDAALSITSESDSRGSGEKKRRKTAAAAGAGTVSSGNAQQNTSSRRLGRSMLTDRLLRPTQAGDVDNVNLPWSCAIYSVVNWMVAFADVEGIQIMCLKCLPYLLEDESQRTTAQRAGLTDSVLRAMVLFPDSIELHTVAFHTLVLLARPLGGNEGMLFHTAMVNTRGIFNNGSSSSKNGIVIMLDSMRRFAQDEILQAMSCWSLVNVALTPLQKSMLVKLGGLTVTSNAMLQHPYNAEVQFRALFALINLVIPTETRPDETEEMREFEREIFQQLGEVGETSEKEMLDASVGQISNLVVVSMKNFCSSEAILNRACLVLHNLSLNEEYHSTLLWTPNCYQMLEWCLGNYPHDHVLQQSAGGTIQRLNATLSADEDLRARFTHSIRAQQQHSLELARQEAVLLQEQQREQEEMQMDVDQ